MWNSVPKVLVHILPPFFTDAALFLNSSSVLDTRTLCRGTSSDPLRTLLRQIAERDDPIARIRRHHRRGAVGGELFPSELRRRRTHARTRFSGGNMNTNTSIKIYQNT